MSSMMMIFGQWASCRHEVIGAIPAPTPPRKATPHRAAPRALMALAPSLLALSLPATATHATPVVQPLPSTAAQGDEARPPLGLPPGPFAPTAPPPAPITPVAVPPGITDGAEWDRAHALLLATAPTPAESAAAAAIAQWRGLVATDSLSFADYAAFLLAYPGFPDETKLRLAAEKALAAGRMGAGTPPSRLAAFFDRFPALTNPARAQYALALTQLARPEAAAAARAAWRGGTMSDAAEATIRAEWGNTFTSADQDARLDALLWDSALPQALRTLPRATPAAQAIALARIALQQGRDPQSPQSAYRPATTYSTDTSDDSQPDLSPAPPYLPGAPLPPAVSANPLPLPPPGAAADPGYLHDRARFLLHHARVGEAASLLAEHPPLAHPAFDARRWLALSLAVAHEAGPDEAIRIAERAPEAFAPGTDLSAAPFAIRDTYTSLMWLGGTQALWWRAERPRAAGLFRAYASAARTPQTRAKGLFWAGRALAPADPAAAAKAYAAAAAWPDQFYGLLALEALRLPLPPLTDLPHPAPTAAQRAAFAARPLVQAVRQVARDAEWQVTIRFFRAIADSATTETDFTLLTDLARQLGRRDLAVIAGSAAETAGFPTFRGASFPLIPTPAGADWTAVHAVARQESQFAQNAISSAGARGLMQLMPGTAADQARHLGLPYSAGALTADPALNIATGNAYFTHLLSVYGGSWPLAAGAYNAGPGNVARWLHQLGDPRTGAIDWPDWIERVPLTETRGYIQHILENAVVYEARNPTHAHYAGPDAIGYFLRGR